MRTNLQGLDGKDVDMTARFCGFFSYRRHGRVFRSALLRSVRSASGQRLTDHVWINQPWAFEDADVEPGDCIAFTGRVREYVKGFHGEDVELRMKNPYRIDYLVANPCRVKVLA
jgi:hypothetical protein